MHTHESLHAMHTNAQARRTQLEALMLAYGLPDPEVSHLFILVAMCVFQHLLSV